MANLRLPDEECFDCPEGNRSMKYVRTRLVRLPGNADEHDHVADYTCSSAGGLEARLTTQTFLPLRAERAKEARCSRFL